MSNPENSARAQDWAPPSPVRSTPEGSGGGEVYASDPAASSPAPAAGGDTRPPHPAAQSSPPPVYDDGLTQTLSSEEITGLHRPPAAHRASSGGDADLRLSGAHHVQPQYAPRPAPQNPASAPPPNQTGPQPRYYDQRGQSYGPPPSYNAPQQWHPQQFAQGSQQYPQQQTQVPNQWPQQQYDPRVQQAAHAGYPGADQRGQRAHRANTIAASSGLTQALRQERHTTVVKPRPQSGWRKAVLVTTFGVVNPGESRIEREDRERRTRVCANVSPPFMFAVLSGKGGGAKTTTTAGLGSVFAKCRGGGEVVVVDVNPDEGNLASRVNPDARHTFKDVLAEAHIGSRSAIRKYTASSPSSQLDVLASSDDLLSPPGYTQDELTKTIATLSNVYNVIGIDCGNNFRSPLVQRVLDTVTAVVVVTNVQFDSGKAALRVHDYLVGTGRAELVKRSFLIMSEHTPVTQDKLRADIEDALRPTVWKDPIYVPFDEHLYEASVIDLDQLNRDTGRAYLEAAAKLSDWYGAPPVPVPAPGPAGVGR